MSKLEAATTEALLALYGDVLDELVRRGHMAGDPTVRTAESVVAQVLGLDRGPDSLADSKGRRYGVIAARVPDGSSLPALEVSRSVDWLIAVVFTPAFGFRYVAALGWETVKRLQKDGVLDLETSQKELDVRDMTARFRQWEERKPK